MKIRKRIVAGGIFLSLLAMSIQAKVSPEEAAKLGAELTPLGAEKAGNADGTIPEWTGGIKEPPANYVPGEGRYPDPFPEDEVKFVITAENMAEHADKLTEGQKAMLQKYPTFKMPVYQTRRSHSSPDWVYEAVKKNASVAELAEGGNGFINHAEAITPFPIPQSAVEIIWNHISRFRGKSIQRKTVQMTPMADGSYNVVKFEEAIKFLTQAEVVDQKADPNVLFYFKQIITAPTRLAGNVLLVHETIDQVKEPRRAWVYNAGQRRVRRAPQVAYDGPGTASDGLRTTDNYDMFNGAPDRYDWKIVGKKEIYIPYNSYRLVSPDVKYDDLIRPGHINTDHARYELHRVWQVEGTLKAGMRHIYAKRVIYFDEDSWGAAAVDQYDGRGELWRVSEAHTMNYYDIKGTSVAGEIVYDLQSSRYLVLGLFNEEPKPYIFDDTLQLQDFTPAALRRSGKR